MSTKNKTEAKTEATEKLIPVRTTEAYLSESGKKGNPLLKASAESRIYANGKANGTTATIIAVLAASGEKMPSDGILPVSALAAGYAVLRKESYKVPAWERLEKMYTTIPGNRSASPALKLGPVVSALIREGANGYLRGFAVNEIATPEIRAAIFGAKN